MLIGAAAYLGVLVATNVMIVLWIAFTGNEFEPREMCVTQPVTCVTGRKLRVTVPKMVATIVCRRATTAATRVTGAEKCVTCDCISVTALPR